MADPETWAVYERMAERWIASRSPQHPDQVSWVRDNRGRGPVVDLGCGPGWGLDGVEPPRLGLDLAAAMLSAARTRQPDLPLVQADIARLPFPARSLGGALAARVHTHLRRTDNPMALAELHRALNENAPVLLQMHNSDHGLESRDEGEFAGRLFSGWTRTEVQDLLVGAGFAIESLETGDKGDHLILARRAVTLPDTVGAGMRLLICGLNPSPYAAEVGVGFGRPGNRFWLAAIAAGLVDRGFDPYRAMRHHRLGMTDLVKRTTRRADELSVDEYRNGLGRVERLVRLLRPAAVCFVGLAGWRAARDRRATAGEQPGGLGGRPLYLMPSTSGLNAGSRLDDLTEHLIQASELADAARDASDEPGHKPATGSGPHSPADPASESSPEQEPG